MDRKGKEGRRGRSASGPGSRVCQCQVLRFGRGALPAGRARESTFRNPKLSSANPKFSSHLLRRHTSRPDLRDNLRGPARLSRLSTFGWSASRSRRARARTSSADVRRLEGVLQAVSALPVRGVAEAAGVREAACSAVRRRRACLRCRWRQCSKPKRELVFAF